MKQEASKEMPVQKKKRFVEAFLERFGIDALNYEVPSHANTLPFTLGGITAVSLVLTIISGIILAMWYAPVPENANVSIRSIMETVFLGSVIRGIHYWSASLTLIAIVLHILRVFLYGSYKNKREGNWIVGVLLFGTMVGLFFTGTTIKWDQEGFEALEHAQAIAGTFGFGGFFSSEVIPVLFRLFTLHASILPIILIILMFIHMLLVKRHKISPLPWKKQAHDNSFTEVAAASVDANSAISKTDEVKTSETKHTFLEHFRTLFGYGYIVLGVVMILSIMAPPAIGPDPLTGIEVTKPLWPFLWIYSLEEWFGINGALVGSAILFTGLLAVPFFDRGSKIAFGKRKLILSIGISIVIVLIILTIYAMLSQPVVHLDM
ncbi:cytochrome b N-terminal domain-containing protein [Neobacillus sp. SM06]|uniref:cytochrome b N-terminal domain-containing protein n=1 Tax=Neobacillus sp. SM06 TaxID=3422492 RepID=UPI003D27F863